MKIMLTLIFICSLFGCSSVPVVPRLPVPEPADIPVVYPEDVICVTDNEDSEECTYYIITVKGIKAFILRERLMMNDFETCQNIIKEHNKHSKQ